MTDILSAIDAAVDERCACGCGRALPADGASAWFATPECQRRWHGRQATDPGSVRGSLTVDPEMARWRPDLAIEEPDTRPLRLVDGHPATYTGTRFAAVFEYTDRPIWHLRLDDGRRFVGADIDPNCDPASLERAMRREWERLERELVDERRVEPADRLAVALSDAGGMWAAVWQEFLRGNGPAAAGPPYTHAFAAPESGGLLGLGEQVSVSYVPYTVEQFDVVYHGGGHAFSLTGPGGWPEPGTRIDISGEQWTVRAVRTEPGGVVHVDLDPVAAEPPVGLFTVSDIQAAMGVSAREAMQAAEQVAEAIGAAFGRAMDNVAQACDTLRRAGVLPEEPPADPMQRAPWLRQHRNTGPAQQRRVPRRIDPGRTR